VFPKLISRASRNPPGRLSEISGLINRPIYAIDGTYQKENVNYFRCTPNQGGTDNSKAHCLFLYFNVLLGIPIDVSVYITSASEETILEEYVM
jgi:hypothetical protein